VARFAGWTVAAKSIADALAAPWNDYFAVQLAMGFRPDELITLQRSNFSGADFETVSLEPLGSLTLKLGTRTLRVPESIRPILTRRFESNTILFPNPDSGLPWRHPKLYNRRYNSRTVAVRLAQRARIVLLAATGMLNKDIAKQLRIRPNTVVRWRGRFFRERCAGIQKDRPRNPKSKASSVDWAQRIVAATTQTKPPNATHWSVRSMLLAGRRSSHR